MHNFHFLVYFSGFGIRVMVVSYNEFGNTPSFTISLYGLRRIGINSSLFFLDLFYLFYFWLHWVFIACVWAFSSCSKQGLLFIVVNVLLIAVTSVVAEHGL